IETDVSFPEGRSVKINFDTSSGGADFALGFGFGNQTTGNARHVAYRSDGSLTTYVTGYNNVRTAAAAFAFSGGDQVALWVTANKAGAAAYVQNVTNGMSDQTVYAFSIPDWSNFYITFRGVSDSVVSLIDYKTESSGGSSKVLKFTRVSKTGSHGNAG